MAVPSWLYKAVILLGAPCIVIVLILALLNSTTNPLNPNPKGSQKRLEECARMFDTAMVTLDSVSNNRFLQMPYKYGSVVDKCLEAVECAFATGQSTTNSTLVNNYGVCHFIMYYFGPFSDCANSLIKKNDTEVPCLQTLFHTDVMNTTNTCDEWDGALECFVEQIQSSCDKTEGEEAAVLLVKKIGYLAEFSQFRSTFCTDEAPSNETFVFQKIQLPII